jgi:uncharacterized protein (DUF2225 family)
MNFNSLFFVTQVECPVCGKINEFENVKAGAYTDTERDTDFCPKGIIWVNSDYQKLNPLLYFMATCPNCFYTHEFNQSFKEWKKNRFFGVRRLSSIRKEHRQELNQAGSVINRLGEALNPEGHPFETAVIKFLLGIRDETIIQDFNPWDVGRHYLRIAWLYRENSEEKVTTHNVNELNLISLERTLRRLQSHFQTQEDQILNLRSATEAFSRRPAGPSQEDPQSEQLRTRITKGLNKIKEDVSSLQESLDELTQICAESRNSSTAPESENIQITTEADENSFSGKTLQGEKNSFIFGSFLTSVKEVWSQVPLNESEALKWALGYYKQSYQEIRDIDQENQEIQAAYLIGELSRRVGDYQGAKGYFDQAKRIGEDFVERNRDDLNKIALAQKIVELAKKQAELSLVKAGSRV